MGMCCSNDCSDCKPMLWCEDCNFYGVADSFDLVDATEDYGTKHRKCPACGSADISAFVGQGESDDLSQ